MSKSIKGLLTICAFALISNVVYGQTYGGRATGVIATTTINGVTTTSIGADTGSLPIAGGTMSTTVPSFVVNGVLSTGVMFSSSSGALKSSQSSSTVNEFAFTLGGMTIVVNRITANAGCICCPGADFGACNGNVLPVAVVITDATGAQTSILSTGQPNQVVTLPQGLGTLTINEHTTGLGTITVNGLRIAASQGGNTYNIVAAQATSVMECLVIGPTAGPVTVSGRVTTASGTAIARATVTLTAPDGNVRTATTNAFGRYSFTGVESGESYVIQVNHRSYTFQSQIINVNEDMVVDLVSN